MEVSKPILEVNRLKKYFPYGKGDTIKAVDDISFSLMKGDILGLVGESGCGKTTCGRTCLNIYTPTSGEVIYDNHNINSMNTLEKKKFHQEVQMIFQDPYSSLDPRMRVNRIVAEGLYGENKSKFEKEERVKEILEKVGLGKEFYNRFPREMSGGQRQRVGIARALISEPKLIICDEPVSALDISIQAQILNLLLDMHDNLNLTYLFVSHNLSTVRYISDRIAVMYAGRIIEIGDTEIIYRRMLHPYTKNLFSAIPSNRWKENNELYEFEKKEDLGNMVDYTKGCLYCNRCKYKMKRCESERPELKEIVLGHSVACHLYEELPV